MLYCRVQMGSKFMADAGFICNKAPTTVVVLREKILDTLCITTTHLKSCHAPGIPTGKKISQIFEPTIYGTVILIFIFPFNNIPVRPMAQRIHSVSVTLVQYVALYDKLYVAAVNNVRSYTSTSSYIFMS
jgi:hypothetical protein